MKRKFRAILGVNSHQVCYTKERHDVWRASFRAVILAWNIWSRKKTSVPPKIILRKETMALPHYYYLMYFNTCGRSNSQGLLIKSIFVE